MFLSTGSSNRSNRVICGSYKPVVCAIFISYLQFKTNNLETDQKKKSTSANPDPTFCFQYKTLLLQPISYPVLAKAHLVFFVELFYEVKNYVFSRDTDITFPCLLVSFFSTTLQK